MNNQQDTKSVLEELEPFTNVKQAITHGEATSIGVDIPIIPALALRHIVEHYPHGELISIQWDGSEVLQTYAQVWARATRILGGLRDLGLKPGNPVILQVDLSQDFAPALWSCFMGGFIPLPVPIASNYQEQNQSLGQLHHAWQLLDSPVILTTSKLAPQIHLALALYTGKNVNIATVEELEANQPDVRLHQNQPKEMGLLLLSSGTTGKPKLVTFNCRTIVNRLLKNQTKVSELHDIIVLAWLPLASISGLADILPRSNVHKRILVPTEIILGNPLRWLELSEKYGVTHTTATNFLLSLVIDKLNIGTEVPRNLSSIQAIGIGAEMIVAKTVRSFLRILAPQGLKSDVIRPSYGLSECHAIAGPGHFPLTATSDEDLFVEIGKPTPEYSIRIVDGDDFLLEEGQVGRIQVIGPNMTSGYYLSPEQNHALFTSDGWLNTGDLGFLRNGRLTITGREKEIVIMNARNYSSLEIELVVEEIEGVEPSYTAAVATRTPTCDTDELVIFFHTFFSDADFLAKLLKGIRRNIASKLGVDPTYLIPISREMIPRTTTGKIQKEQLLQRFEAGVFDSIVAQIDKLVQHDREEGFVAPNTLIERQVAEIWIEVLGLERVGIHDNFFELGGHSLLATQVISRVRELLHVEVPLRQLFESPTIDELARAIESTGRAAQTSSAQSLVPCSRTNPLPLSFAQQRLWFLEQLEPGSTAYSMPYSFRLRGALDVPALAWSLNELVKRHESLRTVFAQGAEEPIQVIHPSAELPVPLVDLQSLPEAEREAEMQRLRSREAQTSFELAVGPFVRAQVIRMGTDDHVVLLTLHHIISDGWSMGVFFEELEIFYRGYCDGQEPTLSPLLVQYADYAVWQREYLQGQRLEKEVDYWREYLHAPLPTLRLPTDFLRPSMQSHRGALEDFLLSSELKAGLLAFSQQSSTTLFMTLLAIFQSLVHRWSGQDDVCVGIPSAGRTRVETEGLIGFFVNTLVVRSTLKEHSTFHDLLMQVRTGTLEAYARQTMPFEKLVEVLQPTRDLSRTPVFQTFFNMVPGGIRPFSLPGVTVEGLSHQEPESKFDLTLYVREEAAGIQLSLVYNADLFKPERIQAFLHQFRGVAEQVIQNPDRPLEAFSLVTPSARSYLPDPQQRLDAEWEGPVWSRLEPHARQNGEAIAIAGPGETWTYEDLEARSNQLAHRLLGQGVKAQEVVAIYAARRPELVLALLGILKAGAAFMILDPSYPSRRLLEMLEIARPCGFFHLEEAGPLPDEVDAWAAGVTCRVRLPAFAVDETDLEELWGNTLKTAPEVKVQPDDVAYVTFTSGSSGTPKCLHGTHRPLSHFMQWYTQALQLTAADRVTMFSGLAHDPLLRDVFTPLWIGGTLCIPDQEALASGRVGEWMNEQQITLMHLTPPLVDVLTGGRDTSRVSCRSLRYAVFGGDSLWRVHLDCIERFAPQARCVNGYGATETPQIMCWYEVTPEPSSNVEQAPIGQGIDGVQVLVLNNAGRQAGIGELGEIYIRTPYLTQGYVNDEALTSARFLPSPFRAEAEDRLYRTGDMGRVSPDGSIEFFGRLDHQVKLRGYRIELGEIEAVLATHPGVKQAVVVVREDVPGDPRLVAYCLMADSALSSSELRRLARSRLPEYMVPSAWVTMEAFPLTPNRKVDRQALPAPEGLGVEPEAAYVAPRTPYEEALAGLWAEVLGLERIGIRDNFFDVGGHSLLALRLRASMEKKFRKDIPLAILFQAPTIGQLAEMLDEGFRPTAWTSLVPMQPDGSNPPFFCVPEAGSTVYSLSDLARHLGTKQPFYGLQPVGMDGDRSPHTRIEDMAAHYIEEIKSVQPEGPYLLGGRCFGSDVAFEIAQQLCAQGKNVALLALIGDNFIPDWARKGVRTSESAYSLTHAFQRARYYLLHSSLGDVVRTALKELNIRFNPRLRYTRRVFQAQLLARANYDRKPYPGRATVFTARSSLPRTCTASILASLAEGGEDVQKIPRVYDRILDEPHVQVVAAKLIACINKALDERFTTKPYTRQAPVAQASKKNGTSTRPVSGIDNSPRSTQADARPTDPGRCLNFSLVLPCYNEAPHFVDSMAEVVRALDAAELEYEIILIDDRSTDETAQKIRSYLSGQHKRNIRAYYHDTNLGRGATVADGIRRANSTYVGFIDIDLETPPQFIPAALDVLASDSADMVLGNRKIGRVLQSPLRLVMSRVYRWLVSRLLKTDSLDTEAGFKFFKRDLILPVLDEVQDSHWFWDTEITVVAQAKGFRIHSLPVTYCRDLTKQSSVRPFQDSWRSFASLLAFAKRHGFARRDATHKEVAD